jgi:hypothetical protein
MIGHASRDFYNSNKGHSWTYYWGGNWNANCDGGLDSHPNMIGYIHSLHLGSATYLAADGHAIKAKRNDIREFNDGIGKMFFVPSGNNRDWKK